MISSGDADRALVGLGAAHDRIAAAMYAIDTHPALGPLRRGPLAGGTQSRWQVVRGEIDLLWAHFVVLGETLERARTARGRDGAELDRLLREAVVAFAADGMPVEPAGAPPTTIASRMSLGELAQRLEQRCASVAAQLSDVDAARTAVLARAAQVAGAVDAVVALAGELGEPEAARAVRATLARAEQADLGDPLAAAPAGRLTGEAEARWAELAGAAAAARAGLAELASLRDGFAPRRAALVALIDDVAAAEQALAETHARVAAKIADPGLAAVPAAAAILRTRVAELDRLGQQARWRELAGDVALAEATAARARERAAELGARAEGLLARRDELRGRLAAYRAKAAARGLAEQDELTEVFARAHDLLHTAPCDLRASTRAVHDFQHTLAAILADAPRGAQSSRGAQSPLGAQRSDVDV